MTSSEALEQLKGQYGELAERAALAAQQATSFGQAIDSTKDAVSSKWMSVFETIFGNKEEATDTWTELANRLYDIFVPPIEALNDRMKEGLDSGWQQMRDAFGDQADAYTTVLEKLAQVGIRCLLLRCAGYNNVDLAAAQKCGITVLRVPGYSPEAVAEHAMALAQAANRRICKAYIKVRNNNFALDGLLGYNLYGSSAGIVGTGRIGAAMARICHGFGMTVLAYDQYKNPALDGIVRYVELDELLRTADLISLHCPLTAETHHIINANTIKMMRDLSLIHI